MEDTNYNNIYNSDNYKDFLNIFNNLNLNGNKDKSDNSCNQISEKILIKSLLKIYYLIKTKKKEKMIVIHFIKAKIIALKNLKKIFVIQKNNY